MKVLIDDGFTIEKGTGIGNYSIYLFNSLKDNGIDVELFKCKKYKNSFVNRYKYLRFINSKKYQKYISDFDYIIYTNYAVPKKINIHAKYISVVHDLVSYRYPKTLPFFNRFYSRNAIKNALKISQYIFTVSKSIKKEICSRFPDYGDKVKVFYPGLYDKIKKLNSDRIIFENPKLKVLSKKTKFFLFVSSIEKRKNIDYVVDAFDMFKKRVICDMKLVLVGKPGYGYDSIVENINSKEYKNDIILAGYTSDKDVNFLYNSAFSYVFPSLYEGFGSTQLECMVTKLPMLLSMIPTNFEISNDYAVFFDLMDTNSLVDAMINIYNNHEKYLKKYDNVDEYISKFDWKVISKDIIKLLEEGD